LPVRRLRYAASTLLNMATPLLRAVQIPAKTVVLLGGTPLEKQAAKLKAKPEIVVGTLGRLADLVSLGKLRTNSLKLLVLDEADRLFARETAELAIALLKSAPSSAVRVLVSATIPERLRREMRPLPSASKLPLPCRPRRYRPSSRGATPSSNRRRAPA